MRGATVSLLILVAPLLLSDFLPFVTEVRAAVTFI